MFYKILRGRPSSHRWAIALVSLPKEAEYDVWPLKVRTSAIHINHIFEVTAKDNKFAFVPVNEFEHANTFSLDATPTTFVVGKDFVVQNFENKHLLAGNGYYFLQTPDNLQKFYNMISGSNDDHCIIKAFLDDKGVKNAMCQCK